MLIDEAAMEFLSLEEMKIVAGINCFDQRFWEDRKLEELDSYFQDMFKGTNFGPDGKDCREDNIDLFLSKRFIKYLEKLQ